MTSGSLQPIRTLVSLGAGTVIGIGVFLETAVMAQLSGSPPQ